LKLINLPNIVTCCNLFCGCLAIYFGLHGQIGLASLFILGGAVFDFFDGLTARAMHISGPIGKELDSLADVVSFGLAPSVLCLHILNTYQPSFEWFPLLAFIMAAFSALRLAKFNIDERQTLSFIGLPTPANAIFWIGLTYLNEIPAVHTAFNGTIYFLLMLVCCFLLICELPMFSLKVKPGHNSFGENKARYILIASTVVILLVSALLGFQYFAASPALIILLYLLLSILF
jgi:CDP-diacylglycerol--serine O-phosphatidyltransferase